MPIILDENLIPEDTNIKGIIGLGYSNNINNQLIENNKIISKNIASYEKNGDEISIIFGDLFKEEKRYVDNLGFCKGKNNDNIEYKLDGFGSKKYSHVLKINDNYYIHFSLDKESKFLLPYKETYIDYSVLHMNYKIIFLLSNEKEYLIYF